MPGVDLPHDEIWQVVETELMQPEDYDRILEMGWSNYFREYMSQRVLNDASERLLPAIVGSGADGSVLGGLPARSGMNLTLIGRREHVAIINKNGLRLDAELSRIQER